jgi:GDPmannose 4,6-dehydratase
LQAICETDKEVRFLNAGTSEVFGNVEEKITTRSVFQPISPYAIGKAKSIENIISFRDRFGIFACSAFLFNHESLLRKTTFVTAKVVQAAQRHARGYKGKISLGNIQIKRDWGWADEYVKAMHHILQLDKPTECIIATGETNSLEQFISHAYSLFGLNWKDHISIEDSLYRKSEIIANYADIQDTARILNWRAEYKMKDIIEMMAHGRDWDGNE